MDLNCFFTNLNTYFGSKAFCHRLLFCRSLSMVLQPGRAIHHQPCGINLSCHRSKLELDGLEFRDWLPKLLTLLRVANGRLKSALSDADCKCGNRDSPSVQNLHGIDEPLPLF